MLIISSANLLIGESVLRASYALDIGSTSRYVGRLSAWRVRIEET